MREWIVPTLGALVMWGFWSFIPKITTQYIEPKTAIVFESLGGVVLMIIILLTMQVPLAVNPKGIALAMITGMLGLLGAFCFLNAVSKGPVTLVATISALYPAISIVLAVFVLQETLTLRQGIGIFLALIAMVLVAV